MKRLQNNNQHHALYFPHDPSDPLYVCDVGYHKTPPNHIYGPAVRPYYLLHLIESGKGEMIRNGVKTTLSKGQAFLITPGEVTTYRADKNEPWSYGWISFYGSFAKTLMDRTTNDLFMTYRQSGLLAVKTAIEKENTHTVDGLNVLFSVLSSIKNLSEPKEENPIEISLKYLENNYFDPIKIEELAAMLGYSRAHFTTVFTQQTGKSPYRYLLDIRLENAKKYLEKAELSVEEIAYSTGFSSLVRFSEQFKKHFGVSPSQYRKNNLITV